MDSIIPYILCLLDNVLQMPNYIQKLSWSTYSVVKYFGTATRMTTILFFKYTLYKCI